MEKDRKKEKSQAVIDATYDPAASSIKTRLHPKGFSKLIKSWKIICCKLIPAWWYVYGSDVSFFLLQFIHCFIFLCIDSCFIYALHSSAPTPLHSSIIHALRLSVISAYNCRLCTTLMRAVIFYIWYIALISHSRVALISHLCSALISLSYVAFIYCSCTSLLAQNIPDRSIV